MEDFHIFCVVVLGVHICLYFFHIFFKSCSFHPYINCLKEFGIEIKPFRVNFSIPSFNRQIHKWGTIRPRLQQAWFTAGIWVSIVLIPLAIFLVIHTIYLAIEQALLNQKINHQSLTVEPMLPGFNLPSSDYIYYLIALGISSIIHELGHAMAAAREDVHISGFNLTIFLIITIASVEISPMDNLPAVKQLRVFCAGVWHNIFLAIIAAIIATALPWMLYPFYEFGTGVQIQSTKDGTGLAGPGGLFVNDVVTQLNHCNVQGITSWQDCILQTATDPTVGFCVSDNFVREHDESVPGKHNPDGNIDCCSSSAKQHLCFELLEKEDEPLPLPQHSCLKARFVVEFASGYCSKASDCPNHLHCFRPSLANTTKLVTISRRQGKVVLFLGHPFDIYRSTTVSDFINIYPLFPSWIPDFITKLCQFITGFSSGIAILNLIPCFCFDGQKIICRLIDFLFAKRIKSRNVRQGIALCSTVVGTLLLIAYVIVAFFLLL